jgi:5'-3' exoribonuclease 2
MGIPYYFYHLTNKYKNIIVNEIPSSNIYIYAIDFNGIIHPEAAKETNEEKLYLNLWNKINNYNDTYNPKSMLIFVDGVAPLAKIIQQRKRRYLTVFKNKIDKMTSTWDTNAISAGTSFMDNLDEYLENKIKNEKKKSFIFNGSKNNGEGEHKIFSYLLSHPIPPNSNIIINGLDADLIILSLISGIENIYLMRENNNDITYLNVNNLKKSLLSELKPKWNLLTDNEIIESYCVMCSILGNDFIPHILTLTMKNNGLNNLIDITTTAINENGSLVNTNDNKINHNCLTQIFTLIAEKENDLIISEVSKIIHKKPTNFILNSNEYGLKNKDPLLTDIYNDKNKWNYYYYKSLFDINMNIDSSLISIMVFNFIKGIYWTYNYYKKLDIDYEWYYPYNYPPTSKDISNYLKVVNEEIVIHKKGNFLNPQVQLLLILPIQSNHLLKEPFKSYTTDIKHGFKHLFPIEFKIQTFMKIHLHECSIILPMINIDKIKKINNI